MAYGIRLDSWVLVVGRFLSLEGTDLVFAPSLASPSLPRWGENRVAGGPKGWALMEERFWRMGIGA